MGMVTRHLAFSFGVSPFSFYFLYLPSLSLFSPGFLHPPSSYLVLFSFSFTFLFDSCVISTLGEKAYLECTYILFHINICDVVN
jgi:hypothetical protein